jgi:collagenase-like PrtC family protease
MKCPVPIHLSTIIGTSNSMGIMYFLERYKNLLITRVCLERTIQLDSLKQIIKKSDIDIEFFIWSGNCKYSEGHCNIHKYSNAFSKEQRVHEKKVRCSYHCMQLKNHEMNLKKQIHS